MLWLRLGNEDCRLANGGGGRGKCPTSCKKGGGIVRKVEMSGRTCPGGICPGGRNVLHSLKPPLPFSRRTLKNLQELPGTVAATGSRMFTVLVY